MGECRPLLASVRTASKRMWKEHSIKRVGIYVKEHPATMTPHPPPHREDQRAVSNGVTGGHSMRLECWSCSPVRRKDLSLLNQPARDCGHACCSLLTPDAAAWGDNSDSGQGTYSQLTGQAPNGPEAPQAHRGPEDRDTDQDDTSAFDYSSVTSCSPDATLRRETTGSDTGEDEEEEDSEVPVLLRPSYGQQQQPKERTVCLRWQIPRLTPHPPLRNAAGGRVDGPAPCLGSTRGKRVVNVRTGSPPLHPKSAFRPIWDDPSKQVSVSLLQRAVRVSPSQHPLWHRENITQKAEAPELLRPPKCLKLKPYFGPRSRPAQ